MVDAADLTVNPNSLAARDTEAILEGLKGNKAKKALVLNKIDGMKRATLLPLTEKSACQSRCSRMCSWSAL